MLVLTVDAKRKQKESVVDFAGLICPDDTKNDFYIELSPATCDEEVSCAPATHTCGVREPEEEKTIPGTLRSRATKLDGTKLTFEWDENLWSSGVDSYSVTLFYKCDPCGRFHLQVKCGSIQASFNNKQCEN